MKKFSKGFTLIELLVVIAIIGILSGIVLTSLNSARNKAANSAVKSNLANMRAQAELFYDTGSTYDGVCDDPTVASALAAADKQGGGTNKCFGDADNWVAATKLKATEGTATHYCVDTKGKSVGITEVQFTAITSALTLCP